MSGKVYLVGSGPGGEGLLTLRAREVIDSADVVLFDQLPGDEILASLPDSAEKIDCGKYGRNHTMEQDEIEALIVDRANLGMKVVRLKLHHPEPAQKRPARQSHGGGLPIGAFGGRREIMELVAPQGPVYQAGTFSGNPLSLRAGIATLQWLHDHKLIYRDLDEKTRALEDSLKRADSGSFVRFGSMFKWFFCKEPPKNYQEIKKCDTGRFGKFWKHMLDAGIFLPPSQFETNFLSTAHSDQDLFTLTRAYIQCLSK